MRHPPRLLPGAGLLAACLLAACEPPPPRAAFDGEVLRTNARQLAGAAAEARLLTQEHAAGHVSGAFASTHRQALATQVHAAAADLARPAPPQLQRVQREAFALAANLELEIARIAAPGEEAGTPQALQARLGVLRQQADALEARP